jgi:hypothetical protein
MNLDEMAKRLTEFHLKFVHSPLEVTLSNVRVKVINLPIDVKVLIKQLESGSPQIVVRAFVDTKKTQVIKISKTDGHVILVEMSNRFRGSHDNLRMSLDKLHKLISDNQYLKLNNDFHRYYKNKINPAPLENVNVEGIINYGEQ